MSEVWGEVMPTYGSLFAGVGGFDMGFDRAGYDCRFQVEWDKNCQNILNRHWPEVPKWWDVSEVNGAELPPVDVLIFGSPCQDLSVAGKRAGLDGARSGLFYEAMRIIKEMRDATANTFPRVVVWENVVGALNSNGGADFGAVLDQMAEAGALVVEWAVLDAQHFGVPQRRRRVFVVAVFDPASAGRCPDPLLPVRESVRGNTTKGNKKGQATANQVAAGFGSGSFGGWTETDTAITLSARDHKSSNTIAVEPFTGTSHAQYGEGIGTIRANGGDLGGGSETLLVEPVVKSRRPQSSTDDKTAPTLQARMGTGGNQTPCVAFSHTQGLDAQPSETAWPTLRKEGNGHGVHTGMAVRRLTPIECERLMGWPDDHTRWTADGKEQADTHRYRQCGNGVATPVAQWIAGHLLPILTTTTTTTTATTTTTDA